MISSGIASPAGSRSNKLKPKVIGDYRVEKTIGRGSFAYVVLARNPVTESNVAIKIVDKTKVDAENLRKAFREMDIMKKLNHPNIIRLYQVIETDLLLCLVTEYASQGEVYTHLKRNGKMPEVEARRKFRQMTAAVAYCHSRGIVHRDLKAENILLDSNMGIKLADFGFSNYFACGNTLKTCCGSPPYAAPELFQGLEYDGFKTDVWSLGVLLYVLVTGGFPFPGNSYENLRIAVLNCNISIPYFVSVECADLIRKMLVPDPHRRYSVQQITQHKWFNMDGDMEAISLVHESMRIAEQFQEALQEPILVHLQQKGFNRDQVICSVREQKFDSSYAAYYLLLGRLKRKGSSAAAPKAFMDSRIATLRSNNDEIPNFSHLSVQDQSVISSPAPRRGSITTGQVTADQNSPSPEPPQISVADVLILNRPSPPERNDEENMTAEDGRTSGSSDENYQPAEPPADMLSRYLHQRRHTLNDNIRSNHIVTSASNRDYIGAVNINPYELCVAPYPMQEMMGFVGQEQPNLSRNPDCAHPFPLNQIFPWQGALSFAPHPFQSFVAPVLHAGTSHIAGLLSPMAGYNNQQAQQAWGRRASDGTRLLASLGVEQNNLANASVYPGMQSISGVSQLSNISPVSALQRCSNTDVPEESTDDEDLKKYLSTRNASKRHTIHEQSNIPFLSPSRELQRQCVPLVHTRHYGSQPYPPRRCSEGTGWGASGSNGGNQLPLPILAHLEKLHNQALGKAESSSSASGNLKQLQQEFKELVASAELNQQLQKLQLQPASSQIVNAVTSSSSDRISARASPPSAPMLHIINEIEDGAHLANVSVNPNSALPNRQDESTARGHQYGVNSDQDCLSGLPAALLSGWTDQNADISAFNTAVNFSTRATQVQQPLTINITDERGKLLSSQHTDMNLRNFAMASIGSNISAGLPFDINVGGFVNPPQPFKSHVDAAAVNYCQAVNPTNSFTICGDGGIGADYTEMFPNSLHSMQGRGFAPDHFAYLYQQEAQKILNSDFNQQGLNTSLLAQTGTVYQEADKMPQTFNFDSHCHMAEVKDSNYCHQQPLATAGESLRFDGCDMRCGSASLITSRDVMPEQVFRATQTVSTIILQLKRVLDQLNVAYTELAVEEDSSRLSGFPDNNRLSYNNYLYGGNSSIVNNDFSPCIETCRRRLSLEAGNSTRLEIGVEPITDVCGNQQKEINDVVGGTIVGFRFCSGSPTLFRKLCSEVVSNLMIN